MPDTINKFTTFILSATDGNTVPSTAILGYKTYVDIGSGTILKLFWDAPIAANNKVDYYKLYISATDNVGKTTTLFNDSIGNVTEYYITSSLLSMLEQTKFKLNIRLTAYSKFGDLYNGDSNTLVLQVSKGCGTYVKVEEGYAQPIMKRALAFTKLDYFPLKVSDGLALLDANGEELYVKAARTQDTEAGWALMQNFYSKDSSKTWAQSDIRYEVLTNAEGEIITDVNNDPIYLL
jgi:hypothetical protein